MKFLNNIFSLLNSELHRYLVFIFFIILLTTIFETLSLASFYPLLDLIIDNSENTDNKIKLLYYDFLNIFEVENDSILTVTILLVAILFTLKILILLFCNWHSANFEFSLRYYLTKKLYSIYLKKNYLDLMKFNSGDIIKNIDYELNMYSSGISSIMTILTEGLILAGIIIFLFYFDFQVTLIILIILAVIFIILQLSYNKTLKRWGSLSQKYEKLRIQNFIETFNAIKEIKVFGKENVFYELMKKFNNKFFHINRKEIFLRSVPRAFLEIVLIIFASTYLLYVSFDDLNVKKYLSSVGIYLVAAYRTFPSANRILTSLQRLKFATSFMNNVTSQINNEDIKISYKIDSSNFLNISLKKSIKIKNCTFYYNDKNNKVLENINAEFKIGKIYGIKGPSGGGKTTLLNILSGLIYPKQGSIFVDEVEIKQTNFKNYQKIISYVPQNTYLFDTSISKNINLDLNDSSSPNHKKISSLIEKLSLDKKISQLAEGIHTRVGERGVNFSGGQIQRIGIARALYHDPKFLILDESTNAIEKDIEEKVVNYLNTIKFDKVILIVAHRETAFKYCDKIFELKSGKLFLK